MALHHPGCCHVRYFHHCHVAPSGSPAHDSLALARGTRARSLSNGAGYRRPRGEQEHTCRTQAGGRRPQALAPHSASDLAPCCLRFQLVLSYRRQNPRLQHHSYPCHHLPHLPCCRHLQRGPRLVFRSTKREVNAHHFRNGCRPHWFHHGRCIPQDCCPIHLSLPFCHWGLLGQLDHHWLGRCHLRSDSREEGRCSFDHELYRNGLFHLHSVPLPCIRRPTVPHGHVCQCCFRDGCHYLHLDHAILAPAGQQETQERRCDRPFVVRLLRVV